MSVRLAENNLKKMGMKFIILRYSRQPNTKVYIQYLDCILQIQSYKDRQLIFYEFSEAFSVDTEFFYTKIKKINIKKRFVPKNKLWLI